MTWGKRKWSNTYITGTWEGEEKWGRDKKNTVEEIMAGQFSKFDENYKLTHPRKSVNP